MSSKKNIEYRITVYKKISNGNNIMSYFISSFNMTSPPALSQGEGDRAEGL